MTVPENTTAEAALGEPTRPAIPPASAWFVFTYWFAQFANWLALLTPVVVTIALKVSAITTPEERAGQLGLVLAIGAFASMVATPIWGALSDRTTARFGRRKVWMLAGMLGGGVGLALIALAPNMVMLGVGWFLAQIAFNANQAALNALLPENVPDEQRGKVSGLLGISTRAAILAGTFITQFTTGSDLLMFLLPWTVTALSIVILFASFKDRSADAATLPRFSLLDLAKAFWVSPRRYPDFAWAFASRFLLFLGTAFLMTYQVYFLGDHLGVSAEDIPSTIFISTLITAVATIIVSVLGGWASDKVGRRKPFVFGAAAVAGVGLVILGTANDLTQFYIGVAIEAAGAGLYYAVDLALVAAVLPNPDAAAKDLAVFQIANSMPQSLAPAIAPALLLIGATTATGNYVAVFVAAAIFAVLGALLILPVKGTR